MDMPLEQIMQMLQGHAQGGLLQSILLILIWLNVRSLKLAMIKLEDSHDKRIAALEIEIEKVKGQLMVRHQTT